MKFINDQIVFLYIIYLILIVCCFSNSADLMATEVRLDYCEGKKFKLITGGYSIELNEQTKHKILIHHPRSWGVLGLCLLADDPNSNLLNSIDLISPSNTDDQIQVVINGQKSWADYELTLFVFKNNPGLVRWQLKLKANQISKKVISKRELQPHYPLNYGLRPVDPSEFIVGNFPANFHAKQVPFAAPFIYMSSHSWWYGTLLYFEDLTSLNEMFEITQTAVNRHSIDLSTSESAFGYKIPEKTLSRLPKNKEITVIDSYLFLLEQCPVDEPDLAIKFLKSLSTIYDFIKKPETELTDWQEIARREISDLNHPAIWVDVDGQPFLRAYVADKRTSAELISQLDVLLALKKYQLEYGGVQPFVDKLAATPPRFFSEKFKAITNDFPHKEKGDSWYLVEELTQIAKLAQLHEYTARDILFSSVESMITLAQNVNYEFPTFFSLKNLDAVQGSETDVCGGYAYLMLELYEMTDNDRYLEEVKKSIQHIRGKNFSLNYELQMTAMAATAAARLYEITKDTTYLDLSYMPLANIMQNCWLWECDYGYAKSYSTFFGMSPMSYAGVITIKEQYEAWMYLVEYLRIVHGVIPDYVEKLLAEFCRYTLFTLKYAMPPLMPKEAIELKPHEWEGVDENIPSFYFPFEDIREGRSKSGQIGQELYGSGGPITFAAEAYVKLRPDVSVYSEYPILWYDDLVFTLAGTKDYSCHVKILGNNIGHILDRQGQKILLQENIFKATGGETYTIIMNQ